MARRKTKKARGPIRLNIGGGELELPGFINIDRRNGTEAFPLGYEENSVDEIRASHILEHFPHAQTAAVVFDWARALKPGGVLKIAVPDLDYIISKYQDPKCGEPVEGYLLGGQTDPNDFHFSMFNRRKLWSAMHAAGLIDIQPWKSDVGDCAAMDVSLNLQGVKPAADADKPEEQVPICAVMSVPRLGFMDNYYSAYQALLPLGIKMRMVQGAYWHQALEECMEDVVEVPDPPVFVLTVDYDSVFDIDNVRGLTRLMLEHPEIDALAPIQMRRTGEFPLITTYQVSEDGKTCVAPWEKFEPLTQKIRSGHFGLTMIRVSSLLDMPHPWFMPVPNKDGRWRENRIDADVNFWAQWDKHGKTLHLANRISIGHCELMITWPDLALKPLHQHVSDYNEKGKPALMWE
jgi:hypothetical protein